jgi:hypothetical protein
MCCFPFLKRQPGHAALCGRDDHPGRNRQKQKSDEEAPGAAPQANRALQIARCRVQNEKDFPISVENRL